MTRHEAVMKAKNLCASKRTEEFGTVYSFIHGGVRTEGSNAGHTADWRWLTPDEIERVGLDAGWVAHDFMTIGSPERLA